MTADEQRRRMSEIGRKPRVKFTQEMDCAIRELRANGEWFQRIAVRVGVAHKTLMRRVDELGISRERLR